jgi:hypothetical protein
MCRIFRRTIPVVDGSDGRKTIDGSPMTVRSCRTSYVENDH